VRPCDQSRPRRAAAAGFPVGRQMVYERIMLGNALQNWLNSHGLLAISGAVLGIITTLSLILVVGGYWMVTR